jgi:nucleotide-binding universal stress UspA family protein
MTQSNLSGRSINGYDVLERAGESRYGTLYRVRQKSVGRDVALRVLPVQIAPDQREIFNREAARIAMLEHANICPTYDFGLLDDQTPYLVTRWLGVETLATRFDRAPQLPSIGEIRWLFLRMAHALDYVHAQGMLHGDFGTPAVAIDMQHTPHLIEVGTTPLITQLTRKTGPVTAVGTISTTLPAYTPPEIWRGEKATPAADQYALAITLYYLLSRGIPFEGETAMQQAFQHMSAAPKPVHTLRPQIAPALSDVINRALAKKPQDRYPDCMEFFKAFEAVTQGADGDAVGFWTDAFAVKNAAPARPHDVFLSYSRADNEMMRRVYASLQAGGVRVWMDQEELEPGTPSWKRAIQHAIDESAAVVVLLSPDAKSSKWVEAELDYAEGQQKKIFPLLVRGDKSSAVPFGYTMAQWLDVQYGYDAALEKLVLALRKHVG